MDSRKVRLSIRLISILLCLFIVASSLITAFPHRVQAWSAVSAVAPTHQYILRQAFTQLENDPAFDARIFPNLNQILASEGVSIVSLDGIATGPGPDVQKTVMDSDHYYNPRSNIPDNQRGGAPAAVKREYGNLLTALQSMKYDTAAHAAGWAAHFLADVETPYHVNGTPFENIQKIYNDQIKPTSSAQYQLFLPENIRGPLTQGYGTLGGKESNATFRPEAESYFAAHAKPENANKDWFDPWYWNGTSYLTSSHVLWEANVITQVPGVLGKQDVPYTLKGYSNDWKATPSFTKYRQNQLLAVEAFTRATALDGLNNQIANEKDVGQAAVQKSVQRVLTLWRSSFTALKPSIEFVTSDYNKPENIKVVAKVSNVGGGNSQNTQLKLTVSGGSVKGSTTQNIGTLGAGKTGQFTFEVVVSSRSGSTIKLETICSYSQPDLQYASVEARSSPLPTPITPTPTYTNTSGIDHSIVVVVNGSSQMKGMTFDELLDKIIRAIDAFPQKGMEIGLVAYGGQNEQEGIVISGPGFIPKTNFRDVIASGYGLQLEAMGKAPLAEAITRAGQLIQNQAKADSATIILISNSGVDNCGGDPIQAAKGLNPSTVIQREFWIPFNNPVVAASNIPVKLQVLGIGVNFSQEEQRLKDIASAGNGKYYSVSDISKLASAAEDAIRSSTTSGLFGGIQFQTWWLYIACILISINSGIDISA